MTMYDELIPRIKNSVRERKGYCKLQRRHDWVNTIEMIKDGRIVASAFGVERQHISATSQIMLLGIEADAMITTADSYVIVGKIPDHGPIPVPARGSLGQRFNAGDPMVSEAMAVMLTEKSGKNFIANFPYDDTDKGLIWRENGFEKFNPGSGEIAQEMNAAFARIPEIEHEAAQWKQYLPIVMQHGVSVVVWENCLRAGTLWEELSQGDHPILLTTDAQAYRSTSDIAFLRI